MVTLAIGDGGVRTDARGGEYTRRLAQSQLRPVVHGHEEWVVTNRSLILVSQTLLRIASQEAVDEILCRLRDVCG